MYEVAVYLARLIVFLILMASGVSKLVDCSSFVSSIRISLPTKIKTSNLLASVFCVVLSISELGLGFLIVTYPVMPVAILTAGLFIIFAIYVLVQVQSGNQNSCACFGTAFSTSFSYKLVFRNVTLAILAIVAVASIDVHFPASWIVGEEHSVKPAAVLTGFVTLIGLYVKWALIEGGSRSSRKQQSVDPDRIDKAAISLGISASRVSENAMLIATSEGCSACEPVRTMLAPYTTSGERSSGSIIVLLHETSKVTKVVLDETTINRAVIAADVPKGWCRINLGTVYFPSIVVNRAGENAFVEVGAEAAMQRFLRLQLDS